VRAGLAAGAAAAFLLAGCGGSASDREVGSSRILVATLGDSVTAGSPGYDPDPAQRRELGFGQNAESQWQYWAQRKNPRLRFRNCGVFGERTDEIASRLNECVRGAQVLVVQGGIEDLAQKLPAARTAANLRRLVRRARALGVRVALADVLPWNNGYPVADPGIRRLNALIASVARAEGLRLLPFHDTLEDPGRPGRMAERLTADGDHPSVEGYRRLGELAFSLP
jgi:lysophospholipase L1-like esterase